MAWKVVEHVRSLFGLSERRACTILGVDRASIRYAPRRADDAGTRERLRSIAAERRRFGYRLVRRPFGYVCLGSKRFQFSSDQKMSAFQLSVQSSGQWKAKK